MKYIYHSSIRESLGGGLCVPDSGAIRGVLHQPQPLQGQSAYTAKLINQSK